MEMYKEIKAKSSKNGQSIVAFDRCFFNHFIKATANFTDIGKK